jgi:hypothetical protein
MTLEEHEMLMLLFAKQEQTIFVLLEILKSRGLIENDDIAAFHSVVIGDVAASESLLRRTAEAYLRTAKASQVILPPKTGEALLS